MPEREKLRVTMLGPGMDVPGGMTTVSTTWLDSPLLQDTEVQYVGTMGEGTRVKKIGKMARGQVHFFKALRPLPDLFHIHVAARRSFLRKLWYFEQCRSTGRPVIVHVHGSEFSDFYKESPKNAALIRRMFGRATMVIAVSRSAKEDFIEWTGGRARVRVLYNPVVLGDFDFPGERVLSQPPTVLFMGVIGRRKGAFDLARTIDGVTRAVPGTRFVFGGNGQVKRLKALLDELGVSASATVLGWVSGPEKARAFSQASIYCLPSHNEGLPVSVLEAMAARLPVVSSDIAGIPEACLHERTGLLCEPGDRAMLTAHLVRLARDPQLRLTMGAAGREHAEYNFDADQVVERLLTLWDEALQVSGRLDNQAFAS